MATTIKLKNSVTTTNAPSSLVQGEVAINITDKKVWVGNAATTPIQLLGDGGSASFTSIAFGAGTVSNPSITFTGDTNTGIYSPAADTIAFTEGGAEAMRIDSSGNVGIGTSSPGGRLELFYTDVSNPALRLRYNSTSIYGNHLMDGNGNYIIQAPAANGVTSGNLRLRAGALFSVSVNDQPATSQALTIDSSGNVGIGTSSPNVDMSVFAPVLTVKGGLYDGVLELVGSRGDGTATGVGQVRFVQNANTSGKTISYIIGETEGATANNRGGTLQFWTKANAGSLAERMRIDSSGNVGIGTNSPSSFYSEARNLVVGTGSGGQGVTIYAGTTSQSRLMFADGTSGADAYTGFVQYDHSSNSLQFGTNGGNERMRITSGGNLLVGDTTVTGVRFGSIAVASNHAGLFNSQTAGWASLVVVNSGTPTVDLIVFRTTNGGANVGSITYNGSATAYNTSSDYRLKENIAPMTGALGIVSQLKPCTFTWKSTGEASQGFIAHELQAVVPDCVTGEKDAVDAEGKPIYQGVDTSFLVATLTAAIQEQQAMIEELKQEVAKLKGA